jgi:hypothetical protein
VFSPGRRLLHKLRPRPLRGWPGEGFTGRARPTVLLRCSSDLEQATDLPPCARRQLEAGRGHRQHCEKGDCSPSKKAPTPNTPPFLSSFAGFFRRRAGFSVAGFQSHPPLSWPAHESLSQFSCPGSVACSLHTRRSALVSQQRPEARFAGAPAASHSRGERPVT